MICFSNYCIETAIFVFSVILVIVPFEKGFLAIRRLLSLYAKFSISRNSAHGCCTCLLKTYRLNGF